MVNHRGFRWVQLLYTIGEQDNIESYSENN